MPLKFEIKSGVTLPIDVAELSIEKLKPLSAKEVSQLPVWCGNRQVPCSELFDVTGSAADDTLIFSGDCSRVKSIGAGLRSGRIEVHGSAGPHLGAQMSGGGIDVTGNAGDWAGAEMENGRLQIRGDAGNQLGAAYRGSTRGMTGGEILVHGNAGVETGRQMRRGLIAVAGDTGEGTGFGMIAGTILVGGVCGPRAGAGLKRGSLILLQEPESLSSSSTYRFATVTRPTFLQLYFRHLRKAGFPLSENVFKDRYRIYRGDFLELGKGEILCRESN